MSFDIIDKSKENLKSDLKNILESLDNGFEAENVLEKKQLNKVIHVLTNTELKRYSNLINDYAYLKNFNYLNLSEIHETIEELYNNIHQAKEDIDIERFFKEGKRVDFDKLEKQLKARKILKKFPNFKFSELKKIIKEPILQIENYAGEIITYDRFFVKKSMIAIIQMIFNEMDLYIINSGVEGSGKSCWCSQQILYFYTILKRLGLIEYEYDMKKMFFSSIVSYLEEQDLQKNDDYFRIMGLDEAYDLNRQNYREQTSLLFKDDMRTGRKLLRINIFNLPQLGELDTTITLSRANFIFECKVENDVKTSTLKKGIINMYIIPRGKQIYSDYYKRNLYRSDVLKAFSKQLEKKGDYYLEPPPQCLIKSLKFGEVWGFDRIKYSKYIKEENKKKRFKGSVKTTDYVAYILWSKLPEIKHWGSFDLKDKTDKKLYDTLRKWLKSIENKFVYDSELREKFELLYKKEKSI